MYCGIFLLLPVVDDLADLDRVPGPCLRDRDRRGSVGELEDREPADGLLRLDERSVKNAHLVTLPADRRRGARRLELGAAIGDLRAVRLEPLEDVPVDSLLLRRRARLVVHSIVDEEECVLRHLFLLGRSAGTTNGLPRNRQPTTGFSSILPPGRIRAPVGGARASP